MIIDISEDDYAAFLDAICANKTTSEIVITKLMRDYIKQYWSTLDPCLDCGLKHPTNASK